MSLFAIREFFGEKSLKGGGNEPLSAAETAINCVLRGGVIRPLREPLQTEDQVVVGAKTVHRHVARDGTVNWWSWPVDVNVVESPLVRDEHRRSYWSMPGSDQKPRYRSELTAGTAAAPRIPLPAVIDHSRDGYELGVPAPAEAPGTNDTATHGDLDVDIVSGNPSAAYADYKGNIATQTAELAAKHGGSGYPYYLGTTALLATSDMLDYNVFLAGTYQRIAAGDPNFGNLPVGETGPPQAFRIPLGLASALRALPDITYPFAGNNRQQQIDWADDVALHRRQMVFRSITLMDSLLNPMTGARANYYLSARVGHDDNDIPVVTLHPPEDQLDAASRPGQSTMIQPIRFRNLRLVYVQTPESTVTPAQLSAGTFRAYNYVYTWVSRYGEEGPPSPPSNPVYSDSLVPGAELNMNLSSAPASVRDLSGLVRLYRSTPGIDEARFQFVGEQKVTDVSADEITFTDNAENVGEPVPSRDWLPPPAGLQGLTRLENGSLCGFIGRDMFFSIPFLPHAWPEQYTIRVDDPIVAVAETPLGLHVLTSGLPVLLTGVPGSFAVTTSEFPEACLDANTVVRMGDSIMYFSPDGLAQLAGIEGQVVTESFLTPEDWRDKYLEQGLRGYYWEDRYVALSGTTTTGFMLERTVPGLVEVGMGFPNLPTAGYSDRNDGNLYLAIGSRLHLFDAANDALVWLWSSRLRTTAGLKAYTRALVHIESMRDGDWIELSVPSPEVARSTYRPVAFLKRMDGRLYRILPLPPVGSIWHDTSTTSVPE